MGLGRLLRAALALRINELNEVISAEFLQLFSCLLDLRSLLALLSFLLFLLVLYATQLFLRLFCVLFFCYQVLVLLKCVLVEIFQVLLDVHWLSVQLVQDVFEQFVGLHELGFILPQLCLVLLELLTHVLKHFAEVSIVENQAKNHCLMDVDRRKFVRVAFINDLGYLRKVLRNFGRALLHNQVVLITQLFKKQFVRAQVRQERQWLHHNFEGSECGRRLLSLFD